MLNSELGDAPVSPSLSKRAVIFRMMLLVENLKNIHQILYTDNTRSQILGWYIPLNQSIYKHSRCDFSHLSIEPIDMEMETKLMLIAKQYNAVRMIAQVSDEQISLHQTLLERYEMFAISKGIIGLVRL